MGSCCASGEDDQAFVNNYNSKTRKCEPQLGFTPCRNLEICSNFDNYEPKALNFCLKSGFEKRRKRKNNCESNADNSNRICGTKLCGVEFIFSHKMNQTETDDEIMVIEELGSEHNTIQCDSSISVKGVQNIGNTCYLNACLQCLLASKPLKDYFKGSKWEKDININSIAKGKIAKIYSKFVNISSSQGFRNKDVVDFKNQLCKINPKFKGYDQQDSHELFSAILEALSEDLSTTNNLGKSNSIYTQDKSINEVSDLMWEQSKELELSIINKLFQGQLVNIIHCTECKNDLYDFNNFTSLSLEIPKIEPNSSEDYLPKIMLDDCFDETTKIIKLDKDQNFYCKFCNKTVEITKSLKICRLPKLLVIHLKRFEINGDNASKNLVEVEVPKRKLDIRDYVHPDFLTENSNACYNLYGIIHHSGSLKEGHYTAEVKSKGDNKDWLRCNDSYVDKSNPCVNSNTPYVLFYSQSDMRFKR